MEGSCAGSLDQPFDRISPDIARKAGVFNRAAFEDHSAQCVAPLCLYDSVTVGPCGKAGADTDHDRGIIFCGAGVLAAAFDAG